MDWHRNDIFPRGIVRKMKKNRADRETTALKAAKRLTRTTMD